MDFHLCDDVQLGCAEAWPVVTSVKLALPARPLAAPLTRPLARLPVRPSTCSPAQTPVRPHTVWLCHLVGFLAPEVEFKLSVLSQ